MPLADGGHSREIDGELIVVLVAVDGAHEADEGILRTREGLSRHRDNILIAGVVQREVSPLVTCIQHEAVGVGRLQVGVTALVGVTVDVDRRAGQVAIGRALNVATIRQAEL